MFHVFLFAFLGTLFTLFAFFAGRAHLLVLAVPAGLLALWMFDTAIRSGIGVWRRSKQRKRVNTTTDR